MSLRAPTLQPLHAVLPPPKRVARTAYPLCAEDPVVPPNQAHMIRDALKAKGVPVAYIEFAGESHGWRRAETIVRAKEAELAFYARVFGFTPADELPPLEIENEAALG